MQEYTDLPVPEEYADPQGGTFGGDFGAASLEPGRATPEGVHISLEEAPVPAPDGSIGIRVNVEVIMDQIHQNWAGQLAQQIQRNAELGAALSATNDELNEVRAKLAALTEVTNAPAEETLTRVRDIPADQDNLDYRPE